MASRRTLLFTAGLALLGAGGCTSNPVAAESTSSSRGGASPGGVSPGSPAPSPDTARSTLVQALQRTQRASYRYSVRGGLPDGESIRGDGAFDPQGRRFDSSTKIAGKYPSNVHKIIIGRDEYVWQPVQGIWVHLDLRRIKATSPLYVDTSDPTGLGTFAAVIEKATGDWDKGSVSQPEAHRYTGAFLPNNEKTYLPVGAPSMWALAFQADATFTVTTDEQGWVASITVQFTQSKGPVLTQTTTISSHAAKLPIKAPPKAQVREADSVYYK
jgi:hypothetical protein